MANNIPQVWLAAGLRTPFVRVDGALAMRDSLALSVPVVQAMASKVSGPIDLGVWGAVALNLAYSNLAREVWLEAKLDPHVPTYTTIMQCCTSMMGAFQAAGMLTDGRELALVGGVESMSRVQFGLNQNLSFWLRRFGQARSAGARLSLLRTLNPSDIRLYVPRVQNRVTGKSMGEHCEDMAKTWNISRQEQDELALASHRAAVAGQDRGFFDDLIISVDGHATRRLSAPRHLARAAGAAQSRVRHDQRPRHAHRRQLVAVDRRRRRRLGRDREGTRAPAGRRRRACASSISKPRRSISFTRDC